MKITLGSPHPIYLDYLSPVCPHTMHFNPHLKRKNRAVVRSYIRSRSKKEINFSLLAVIRTDILEIRDTYELLDVESSNVRKDKNRDDLNKNATNIACE